MPETGEGIRVPPPLVPLAAVLVAGLTHYWMDLPQLPPGSWVVGGVLVLLGVALLGWAILEQSRLGTNPDVRAPTTALVVSGPYQFTRNPIYLGFLLAQAGIGLWSGWWLATVLVPVSGWALTRFVIRREEQWLSGLFPHYVDYCDRVRRWF